MSTHLIKLRMAVLVTACVANAMALDQGEETVRSLCADRAAIEQVYHRHRQNVSQSFEIAVPAHTILHLVKLDLRKEQVLRDIFGHNIPDADVQEEVRRIDSTTRDAGVLSEIKAALGNDPVRFARTIARPIVVERRLRQNFDSNQALHANHRSRATQARERWIATRDRPLAERLEAVKAGDGLRVEDIEWTWHPPPSTAASRDAKPAFTDLPAELQRVLRLQLKQVGDVSAVIEDSHHFQVFLCAKLTPQALAVRACILPKLSLDTWLESISPLKS